MEDKLLKTVTDELCKHFKDPIDIECSYCEAAKAVIPIIRADMQREIIKWGEEDCPHFGFALNHAYKKRHSCMECWQELLSLDYFTKGIVKSGTFKEVKDGKE